MKLRSHKYPDTNEYIDTTYHDEKEKSLDVGYQRLKIFHIKNYPELVSIKKLFIDHNNLDSLPSSNIVPNLTELTCESNQLRNIPFYPKLKFLNISKNQITDLSNYHNSELEYLDCSYNSNFQFNFILLKCKQLFINNTELESIDLSLVPSLEILDCGNNKLKQISGGENLEEINIQQNQIERLPVWPNLIQLCADFNLVSEVPSFPKLFSLNISHNQIVKLNDQPVIERLVANNNKINNIGSMPNLKLIELENNLLTKFRIPNSAEYISVQFNPINELILEKNTISYLKEIQINFGIYQYFYSKYYDYFKAISVTINQEKLYENLKKIQTIFGDSTTEYIAQKFSRIKFVNRENELYKISIKVYLNYFKDKKEDPKILQEKEFQTLLNNLTKMYYKIIIFTIYFNE